MLARPITSATFTLLERDRELGRIGELLERTRAGEGEVLAIEGAAGVGKTELVRAARAAAGTAGLRVLSARGSELERGIGFGVARQLLEPAIGEASGKQREQLLSGSASLARSTLQLNEVGTGPADTFAVLHGLYWLCANLAEQAPLLLAVDDAHWSDAPSLRWLSYLAHRVEGLPILVILAARPTEGGEGSDALRELVGERSAEMLEPAPLSPLAVASVVRMRLGLEAEEAFCHACHAATAGNPFLLGELLRTAAGDGIAPTAASATHIGEMASATVARFVQVRLARLGDAAIALARAVAVLGVGAELRHAAALASLGQDDAHAAADLLREVEILAPGPALDFVHPLARAAVYSDLGPGTQSSAHLRAARLLAAEATEPERVAAQLMASEPAGDPWSVDALRAAARRALEAGTPDTAARYLERALMEPPPPDRRAEITYDLGMATLPLDPQIAVGHLQGALDATTGPARRMAVALPLAKALGFADRPGEGVAMLEGEIPGLGAEQTELRLTAEREKLLWAHFSGDNTRRQEHSAELRRIAGDLNGTTPSERGMLGLLSWELLTVDGTATEILAAAERAIGPEFSFVDPSLGFEIPTLVAAAYLFCDELDRAFELFDLGVRELSERGWLVHLVFTYSHRAHVHLRRGDLREADADIRTSLEIAKELGPSYPAWWYTFGNLLQVLTALGALEEAGQVIAGSGLGEALPDAVIFPLPRVARGALRVAQGRHESGLEDLLAAGTWLEQRGYRNPSWSAWRMPAAEALAALGRHDEARDVIEEAVRRARSVGAPWALGRALRANALDEGGDRGLELLGESVEVLAPSPCRLEHAESLVALGAALRRGNRRADARVILRDGLDLASRCGAQGLARRAHDELAATGARPRREVLSGLESLTASERRVSQLAADGRSNPEIAQALFVTRKTVEKHLANAFRKLDVNSRTDLPAALAT